jgi:CO dehydrogenase/acetyl-CoA synthase beta subunit
MAVAVEAAAATEDTEEVIEVEEEEVKAVAAMVREREGIEVTVMVMATGEDKGGIHLGEMQ